jgi:hypothetical protein
MATTLADFGDPVHTDAYVLCVYGQPSGITSTLLRATIPAGPSWKATRTSGFTYTDKLGTAAGVTSITLKTGEDGRASVQLKGEGPNLELPTLPLAPPVTVQLRSRGECWGAGYVSAGVQRNTETEFRGQSSPSGSFLGDLD